MIPESAERLVTEWADRNRTLACTREVALVGYVLGQLADPRTDYGPLLDDLCQRRWTVGRVAS
ncbi:MAG: hypothetical protein ACRDRC_05700 [Pseudonocardiaceae bacterium]